MGTIRRDSYEHAHGAMRFLVHHWYGERRGPHGASESWDTARLAAKFGAHPAEAAATSPVQADNTPIVGSGAAAYTASAHTKALIGIGYALLAVAKALERIARTAR
jgi:hypothetical protein